MQQNSGNERASLFHAARALKNNKNNISSLKIGGKVVKDGGIIEAEVLAFFGALFNGHHNVDLVDTLFLIINIWGSFWRVWGN